MAAVGAAVVGALAAAASLFGGDRSGENQQLHRQVNELQERIIQHMQSEQQKTAKFERDKKEMEENHKQALQAVEAMRKDLNASHEKVKQAEETARQFKAAFDQANRPRRWVNQPPEELLAEGVESLRRKGLELDEARCNIAFSGPNGGGKSSLIRSLLANLGKMKYDDGRMPTVSHTTRGTAQITKYDVPGYLLTLWDLPGSNSIDSPVASYVEDAALAAFHMQVLVIKDRFEQVHADILYAGQKFHWQRIIVVNARADQIMEQIEDDEGSKFNHHVALTTIANAHKQEAANTKSPVKGAMGNTVHKGYTLKGEDLFILSAKLLSGTKKPEDLRLRHALQEEPFLRAVLNVCSRQG